jgi:DNA-binding transcriptional regulator YdaS (Cro superfamily)
VPVGGVHVIPHDPGDLGVHLYRWIAATGQGKGRGYSPSTEPTSFGDAMRWFMRAAGGNVSAAARLMGVPRRSLRDWVSGISAPKPDRAAQIARSAQLSSRRERLKPGREARLRAMDVVDISITGSYNYDATERTVNIGQYLEDGVVGDLVDAYLAGWSPAEMRELFADGINDPSGFYTRTMAEPPSSDHGWTVSHVGS